MNPQNNPTNTANNAGNGLSLPPVNPAPVPDNQAPATPAPAAPDPATQPLAAPLHPSQMPATPLAIPQATVPQASSDPTEPQIADDTDLIEKEWVEKAKHLVDKTKNDPYTQNKEINRFKASYIKKRYNKDIQLNQD